ncbi:MAG: hypothetical protein JO219_11185 [Candidatus Eremiobacteraeota bacterium]|nr:hypothetical protein [Candidatus Eremiobacteraeota bacterium]MBV8366660.1 hypothetical protein [Candidatus Eremiobacteraeota bacterium]
MKQSLRSLLLSATGGIDRLKYAAIGISLFTVKHIVDIAIAAVFHANGFLGYFSAFGYWIPLGQPADIAHLTSHEAMFLAALLVVAVPFVWIGVATTLKRLRSINWPLWLVVMFFIPIVNVIFFALLVAMPDIADFVAARAKAPAATAEKPARRILDRIMPFGFFASAAMAVALTAIFGVGAIALGTLVFREYGWGVFVAVPVSQGILAAMLLGYREPRSLIQCLGVAELSVILGGALLLAVALEGAICIAMAAPLALLFAGIGGLIGYQLQRRPMPTAVVPSLIVLLAAPLLMAAEAVAPARPPQLVVSTSIVVHAPPGIVWRNVVTFPELAPPREAIFRLGVAYPVRARIEGRGAGATRYCDFSTGAFVEPITSWDEPRVLAFDVTRNPEPMKELSPYKDLTTPHLHGYLTAERGEFRLLPLPHGDTRLIGTTWYRDNVWPTFYWRLWSDAIIHTIHDRVLAHIKNQAEMQMSAHR